MGTIDEDMNSSGVSQMNDLFDGIDCSQSIGDLCHTYEFCAWTQQSCIFLEDQLTPVIDRNHLEHGSDLFGKELPGDDVGMMLQRGEQDFVAGTDKLLSERVRDEVDRLGRAPGEDYLVLVACTEKLTDLFPGVLEGCRGSFSQFIACAVDVGVVLGVEVGSGIDDGPTPRLRKGWGRADRLQPDSQEWLSKIPFQGSSNRVSLRIRLHGTMWSSPTVPQYLRSHIRIGRSSGSTRDQEAPRRGDPSAMPVWIPVEQMLWDPVPPERGSEWGVDSGMT